MSLQRCPAVLAMSSASVIANSGFPLVITLKAHARVNGIRERKAVVEIERTRQASRASQVSARCTRSIHGDYASPLKHGRRENRGLARRADGLVLTPDTSDQCTSSTLSLQVTIVVRVVLDGERRNTSGTPRPHFIGDRSLATMKALGPITSRKTLCDFRSASRLPHTHRASCRDR